VTCHHHRRHCHHRRYHCRRSFKKIHLCVHSDRQQSVTDLDASQPCYWRRACDHDMGSRSGKRGGRLMPASPRDVISPTNDQNYHRSPCIFWSPSSMEAIFLVFPIPMLLPLPRSDRIASETTVQRWRNLPYTTPVCCKLMFFFCWCYIVLDL
jgi:hypothetical protein